MKHLKNVLVVMDKPKHPQAAFERAMKLHRSTAAHLHLAAFAYHPMVDQQETFDVHQRNAVRKEIIRERTEWLRGVVLDAGASFENLTIEVIWTKHLADWVAERAAIDGYDVVVKSTHHSEALLHTPTDWTLLRNCSAPLLLVSGRSWRKKPVILATLDLERFDRNHVALNKRVLDAAQTMATLYGGTLHCVFAVEISRVLADLDIIDARKAAAAARARASQRCVELLKPYGIPKSRIHMPTGKVGHVVNQISRKTKADLLVMGTTARKGLRGLVIGNSAERVLAKARCDVLALKP